MKLQFENHLDYQDEAVESICGIFEGEEVFRSNFSLVPTHHAADLFPNISHIGIGNAFKLTDEELLQNIRRIQLRNGLTQTTERTLRQAGMNFSVEMETGTGKTYVYTKTMLELHRRYGFTKFIVVVPGIAIKEGVKASFDLTREHFRTLYDNVVYDYFVYDSAKLEQVRSFATSDTIQVMIINIDAFRKSFDNPTDTDDNKSNIIHRYNDKLGYRPIELIRETRPVVIIDEPQSVDNTPKAQEAVRALRPLCCLRYSATHRNPYNLMYKLDSIDAYEKKLVKQIEVGSVSVENYHNDAYINLLRVDNSNGIRAQLELDVQKHGMVKREKKWVRAGDALLDITRRNQYDSYIVQDIWYESADGLWQLSFTSNAVIVRQGHPTGSIDSDRMKRQQIHLTIEAHLDKELQLNPQGIKVLSLFFIDRVANYRTYDAEGNTQPGKYARMFEEEYCQLISRPKYHTLFDELRDKDTPASAVHNGYFSVDKQSKASNKKEKYEAYVDTKGNTAKDDDTFNLIMKDKERLLSFDTPLRFIFSHSALREGWDNPNVFQICTLNETNLEMKKRQEIGRGLRLCVNQAGERIRGFEVNTLTVVANESYDAFVKSLQKEIEDESGFAFGYLRKHAFAHIVVDHTKSEPEYLDTARSETLYRFFIEKGYVVEEVIDRKKQEVAAKVQDKLKLDLKENRVELPEAFDFIRTPVLKVLRGVAGNVMNVKNRNDARRVQCRKEILLDDDFRALWDRVKYKTNYSVSFDSEMLIARCVRRINEELVAGRGRFVTRKVRVMIDAGGIRSDGNERESARTIDEAVTSLPDVVTYLLNETGLTRRTVVGILQRCGRLDVFKVNPQAFIEAAVLIIRNEMRLLLVDGIKYRRIADEVWCQELFTNEELQGYLNTNLLESRKSPYNYVVYDSTVERNMAQHFELSNNVRVYAKLPSWFTIDTPLGNYNPDWVLVWEEEGSEQKLYFVVETKGGLFEEAIKQTEKFKIDCGRKHFAALDTGITLKLADSYEALCNEVM
ncbi:MAG: DEAD/DEAH box helicase family protein [Prevotellaceae bacterium]|jgi:type III restriction enzyme|nr:DEAD/DEAH box helicase family protein [Prevotellaceae bacterium]